MISDIGGQRKNIANCQLPIASFQFARCVGLLCFFYLGLAAPAARADEPNPKKAAKEALAKYQDALVSVKFVLKIASHELRQEIEGTVISPAGLTRVLHSTSSPGAAFCNTPRAD